MYLAFLVNMGEDTVKERGVERSAVKASNLVRTYESVLTRNVVKGSRVLFYGPDDVDTLGWKNILTCYSAPAALNPGWSWLRTPGTMPEAEQKPA
ncbi:hypothetical protein PG995_014821 [Apiospora arundinis]